MNADPRRPDKVQRYVAKSTANGEDLTPDYMNIMGQHSTTGNAAGEAGTDKQPEISSAVEQNPQVRHPAHEDTQKDVLVVTSNAANVIPTSPQYGVAIIPPNNVTASPATESPVENTKKASEAPTDPPPKPADETKDVHSTPSRNDRFKVVKIASLEPFKRGRWKCMDYVDEAPPPSVQQMNNQVTKTVQSMGNNVVTGTYMQTQSLPQQQIQQMILQGGGYTNSGQFIPNLPQMIPQPQYYYPQVPNMPNQNIPQQMNTNIPTQYINNQPYFPAGVVSNPSGFNIPQSYPNIQYMPVQAQNSAFVPTSQNMQMANNYQQSQSYGGQASVSQGNMTHQPMVNGHAYPPQPDPQIIQQPNQIVKNVITSMPQNMAPQQNHMPNPQQIQQPQQQQPVIQQVPQHQQYQPQSGTYQQVTNPHHQQNTHQSQTNMVGTASAPATIIAPVAPVVQAVQVPAQQSQPQPPVEANNVYNNPQFSGSGNSLNATANSENTVDVPETKSTETVISESTDDPTKGAVVNAIDNKIEQAMDLVKSHLMYTVREEVEVLKEKISDLMEKIQQLETENNYLRSQIVKSQPPQALPNATPIYSNVMQNAAPMGQPQHVPVNNSVHQSNPIVSQGIPQNQPHNVQGVHQLPNQVVHQPQNHGISQTQGVYHPQQQAIPQNQGIPQTQSAHQPQVQVLPQSQGVHHPQGQGIPQNQGIPQSQSQIVHHPQGVPQNQGISQSQGQGIPQNQGIPQSQGQGIPQNQGIPQSQGHNVHQIQSHGVPKNQGTPQSQNQTIHQSQGQGISHNQGIPHSQSQGVLQNQGISQPQNQGNISNPPSRIIPNHTAIPHMSQDKVSNE